jgi:GTP cyclohydrolase I
MDATESSVRNNGVSGTNAPSLYKRQDYVDAEATDALSGHVHDILTLLGEDPDREGLVKTPERVAKAYQYLTHGYQMDPRAILESALFEEDYSEMILVRDIEVYSLCEHHMLPFFGKAHVAYIPDGRIVGLSKIPRVVDVFARRLQVQERLTLQIRDAIEEVLRPLGVAVVIEAKHLCKSGISSAVLLAAITPAIRATPRTSPLAIRFISMACSVANCMRIAPSATALRGVSALAETSTIRADPSGATWVNASDPGPRSRYSPISSLTSSSPF